MARWPNPIELTSKHGSVIRFHSLDELAKWHEAEVAFFDGLGLGNKPNQLGGFDAVPYVQSCLAHIKSGVTTLNIIEQRADFDLANPPTEWTNGVNQIRNQLSNLFVKAKYPWTNEPRRKSLMDAIQNATNQEFKQGVIEAFTFTTASQQNLGDASRFPDVLTGRLTGWMIEAGVIKGKLHSGKARQLDELATAYENAKINLLNLAEEQKHQDNSARSELQSLLEKIDSSFQEKITELDDAMSKFVDEQKDEISKFRAFVEQELALQAPVHYWEEKRKRHKKTKNQAFCSLCVLGVLTGLGVAAAGVLLVPKFGNIKDLNLLFSALVLVVITGVTWTVKTVMRVFLTNTHLMHDAEERLAMINSYLALMKTEHPLQGDSIAPVLTALFRPASDGIVKDEPLPLSLLESLTRSGGNRSVG